MICVRCGTEVPKLLDGCCPSCYVARTPIVEVPQVLDLEFCAHCGSQHIGAHWHDVPHDLPMQAIRQDAERGAVKVHKDLRDVGLALREVAQDEKHFQATVQVSGVLEGVPVSQDASFLTRTRRGVCDRCSRRFGGFWAAVVQVRASEREMSPEELERAHRTVAEELTRALDGGNRLAFLQKEEANHGGWDYYIGDIDAGRNCARLLAQRLNGRVQESAKLVGRRGGEEVYRVTFLMRIHLYAPGDFALGKDEGLVMVVGAEQSRVQAVRLRDHHRTKMHESGMRRLGGPEMAQDAVLVSQDEADLQVLDPVTLRTVDVPRPPGYRATGESVRVVRHEGRMWLVPAPMSNSS